MMMNLVFLFLNLALLSWLVWYFLKRQAPADVRTFWLAFLSRVAGGIVLGLLYFDHYKVGDTISFWQDGNHLASLFLESPGKVVKFFWDDSSVPEIVNALQQQTPRSVFFVKICGFLSLISGGNYWVMATWLSFASFAGAWLLYRRLVEFYAPVRQAAALALFFVPSVVFWSSGLIKESLGLSALFVITACCLSWMNGKRVSAMELALMIVCLWVGWNLKYYWIGIFLPVTIPSVIVSLIARKYANTAPYQGFMWIGLFAAFLLLATNVHPNFYASRFLEVIYRNNLEFTRMSEPPRIVQYLNLEPEAASILTNAPAALIAGLFRPFIWESFNTLSWIASAENTVLLLLVLQALLFLKAIFRSPNRVLLYATIIYIVLLITFLALSTPNFGTLSRYRVGALPFLVLICLLPGTLVGKWLAVRKWFG